MKTNPDPAAASATKLPFNFPSKAVHVYQIAEAASDFDVSCMLETRLAQLSAMLAVTYGGGGESFRENSDIVQDHFLWACSYMATECNELFQQVNARRFRHG